MDQVTDEIKNLLLRNNKKYLKRPICKRYSRILKWDTSAVGGELKWLKVNGESD
jgi:hypothetical protein